MIDLFEYELGTHVRVTCTDGTVVEGHIVLILDHHYDLDDETEFDEMDIEQGRGKNICCVSANEVESIEVL